LRLEAERQTHEAKRLLSVAQAVTSFQTNMLESADPNPDMACRYSCIDDLCFSIDYNTGGKFWQWPRWALFCAGVPAQTMVKVFDPTTAGLMCVATVVMSAMVLIGGSAIRLFSEGSAQQSFDTIRSGFVALALVLILPPLRADDPTELFKHGEGISLEGVIPANERGIMSLAVDDKGRIFGGTTGRAAHFFVHNSSTQKTRSLLRLPGGIGLVFVRLADGSFIAGTQADPTRLAVTTDAKAIGRLLHLKLDGETLKTEELGVAVSAQGIHALSYLEKNEQVVGNTWPDGHFFSLDLKTKKITDHGIIAGHRTRRPVSNVFRVGQGIRGFGRLSGIVPLLRTRQRPEAI
jgi:hypothetical protein